MIVEVEQATLQAISRTTANVMRVDSCSIYLLDKRGNERVEFADVPDPTWMENDIKLLAGT